MVYLMAKYDKVATTFTKGDEMKVRALSLSLLTVAGSLFLTSPQIRAANAPVAKAPFPYVYAKAFHIPTETTTEESGYFSLCEGLNSKIYIGTAKYNFNAFLMEFDPKTEKQRIVLDTDKLCGLTNTGYAAQAKIHTRNFVGPSGKIYVGSKQGYRTGSDKTEYPGGYLMIYDPKTDSSTNLGMPYPGQGLIDTVADEERGLIYIVTCEDQHWMLYNIQTGKYRELGPLLVSYATTLIDPQGRAHVLTRDFQLATYDPATDKVSLRDITLGSRKLTQEDFLKVPPTWILNADKTSAYFVRMTDPALWSINLAGNGPTTARELCRLIEGKGYDSRCALTLGPDGRVYSVFRVDNTTGFGGGYLHHLLRYSPKNNQTEDLGVLAVKNPDYYDFKAKKPWSHGFHNLPDGTLTPLHNHMALIVAKDGTIYVTIIYPFTLLRIDPIK